MKVSVRQRAVKKLLEITQTAFWEGKLAEAATWQTVVLIPKEKREFRGIGLVEVTWKVVAVILHRRLTTIHPYVTLLPTETADR